MAHEVETMYYHVDARGRGVPWHRLGTPSTRLLRVPEAMRAGGIEWEVRLSRAFDDQGRDVPQCRFVKRVTDGRVLGVVGTKYRPCQNATLGKLADELLQQGALIETCGSLFQGERIWFLARLPEVYHLAGDPTEVYLLLSNYHNGAGGIEVHVVPIRVVCNNTLNLALRNRRRSWKCKHTGDVLAKVDEARRSLGLLRDYMAELANKAEVLRAIRLAPDDWSDLVTRLLPLPEDEKESSVELQKRRQAELRQRMMVPDLKEHRWTAWGAINAVADWVDHTVPTVKRGQWRDTQFAKIVDGHPLLDRALSLLEG